MKIMHLLQSSFFSGAENVVCQIIDMFRDNTDVDMVYVSKNGPIKKNIEEKGIQFYGLNSFDIKNVRKAINEIKPDLIHAHDIAASVLAAICAPGGCEIVSHVHVNNNNMAKISMKTLIFLTMSVRFKKIFWVSQSCFDGFIFKNILKNKSRVLCNVIDKSSVICKMQKDKNEYHYDVAYVGRITYQKNPEKLVDVFKILYEMNPQIKVAVVGTGDKFEEFVNLIEKNGLNENIEILGFMDNPLKLLYSSKVMVMTSRYEGLPMTVLEAMALGVPIVSTPVDGLKEIVFNGENGFLVNDTREIAVRLNEIIQDENMRSDMSNRSIEIFDNVMNIEKYRNIISGVYGLEKAL